MTTKHLRFEIVLVFGLVLLVGCAQNQNEAQAAPSETKSSIEKSPNAEVSSVAVDATQRNPVNEQWITMPSRLRFPSVVSIEVAPSWDARVARFPKVDQAYLAGVSDRYFGTVEFQDEAEQRQLIQQGFPMPEEWLAAQNIPMAELERLVEQDNVKAKMFYVDRVSQEIGPILARGDGLDNTPEGRALLSRFAKATRMAQDLLRTSRSPFAAYLAGRIYTAGSFGTPPESFAGAFQMARDLGHERAREFQGRFFATHPDLDAAGVMASYSLLKGFAKL